METTIPKLELKLEARIEGLGEIYRSNDRFDISLGDLRAHGMYMPISPRDFAYARMKVGKEHPLNAEGSHTSAGILHVRKSNPLLALESPLLNPYLARKAVEADIAKKYFVTEDTELYELYHKQAERDLNKSPEEREVLILPSGESFNISLIENPEIFKGIFKDVSGEYLKFEDMDSIRLFSAGPDAVDSKKGTVLTQLWMHGISFNGRGRPDLDGIGREYGGGLSLSQTLLGVKSYIGTPKQIEKESLLAKAGNWISRRWN